MKPRFRKIFKILILLILFFILLIFGYFFVGKGKQSESIVWGVNFSQKHTERLELDWRETYLALLDDLSVKNIKLAAHWDLLGPEKNEYYFEDLDWQINTAKERGAKIVLVIGMKTPRWPECHVPGWALELPKQKQQEEILNLLEKIVLRYRDSDAIWAWQVENEPLFPFGECPWTDKKFLEKEIELVKSLDQMKRPVIISDSGESSFWISAAKLGDIVGVTMYRKVWFKELKIYVSYPYPPVFYVRKAKIVEKLFGKEVICIELQAEPWGSTLLYYSPLEEQEKTMNPERFNSNIEFAKKTGFDKFYLWGVEWWYWMKEKQNQPEIWQEAKKLFEQ